MAVPEAPPAQPRPRCLSAANVLSASRVPLALAMVAAWLHGQPGVAFACFALAVATDLVDGPLARRRGETSAIGGFLDHATDALLVALGLGALASQAAVPALLPWLVLGSFTQYALDSRVLAGQPLRASALGRWNGIAYYALLGTALGRAALGAEWLPAAWILVAGWLLCATTCVSMADRAWAFLRLRG